VLKAFQQGPENISLAQLSMLRLFLTFTIVNFRVYIFKLKTERKSTLFQLNVVIERAISRQSEVVKNPLKYNFERLFLSCLPALEGYEQKMITSKSKRENNDFQKF